MNARSELLHTRELQTGYRQGGQKIPVSGPLPELTIFTGQLICLLGPNGSGKSTLLRTLAGLQPALAGSVEIEGQTGFSSAGLAKKISLVLTDRVVGSQLDVYSLVSLGRYPWTGWLGGLTEDDRTAIRLAIESTGIGDLLERKVYTLSDGETQKVMLARALAQDTPLLMLDEPTAHLDLPSRIRLMRLLHQLARDLNKGILLSTHELDLALQVADEVWLLQVAGPLYKGTPEDLILDGVFEAVFAREDVVFDRATGVFRIPPQGQYRIRLEGMGVVAFWTRRALQREGFVVDGDAAAGSGGVAADATRVSESAADATGSAADATGSAAGVTGAAGTGGSASATGLIRIVEEAGRPVWLLEVGGDATAGATRHGAGRFDSIAKLLEALRHTHFS